MEAHASTYSASELGALAVQQSHIRPGWGKGGLKGHTRFKVAHVGTEGWRRRSGTEKWVGLLSEDMDSEGGLI